MLPFPAPMLTTSGAEHGGGEFSSVRRALSYPHNPTQLESVWQYFTFRTGICSDWRGKMDNASTIVRNGSGESVGVRRVVW